MVASNFFFSLLTYQPNSKQTNVCANTYRFCFFSERGLRKSVEVKEKSERKKKEYKCRWYIYTKYKFI